MVKSEDANIATFPNIMPGAFYPATSKLFLPPNEIQYNLNCKLMQSSCLEAGCCHLGVFEELSKDA